MKISINDLNPSRRLPISGSETWLARLYGDFPAPEGSAPPITGELELTRDDGGCVTVTGALNYAPFLPCSRCAKPLPWPLRMEVEARYYPEDVNPAPREKNLSKADLDAYYLIDHAVDLEELVNDAVQTALPSQILSVDGNGENCAVCQEDVSTPYVYIEDETKKPGAEPDEKASPFAVLKGLKLPN